MTLVEFLHPLRKSGNKNNILAVLYYLKRYSGQEQVTITDIRSALVKGFLPGAKKLNISGVLARSAPYVESPGGTKGKLLWRLTDTGDKYVRDLTGLPEADIEIEHEAGSLENIVSKMANENARLYIEEAVKCLKIGALRAATVFIWAGAASTIQAKLLSYPLKDLNTAVKTHDPKARNIKTMDSFSYIKESTQLLAARDLGMFDKSQYSTLEDALNLRNRCGHPGKYSPGIKKVSSMIEDLLGIVF